MADVEKAIEENSKLNETKIRIAKKLERRARMINEMKASSTLGKMMVWLKYKWFDSILFYVTMILTGCLFGVAAKIVWEVWKIIFNVNL